MTHDYFWLLVGVLLGIVPGALLVEHMWRRSIEEKGREGGRILVRGVLYWVVPRTREHCGCNICDGPVQFPGAEYCVSHGCQNYEERKEYR